MLQITREGRVGFRHIAVEGGGAFLLDPLEPINEYRVIAGKVGDIFEGAPFCGVGALSELVLRQLTDELADGFVLMVEACPDGIR